MYALAQYDSLPHCCRYLAFFIVVDRSFLCCCAHWNEREEASLSLLSKSRPNLMCHFVVLRSIIVTFAINHQCHFVCLHCEFAHSDDKLHSAGQRQRCTAWTAARLRPHSKTKIQCIASNVTQLAHVVVLYHE